MDDNTTTNNNVNNAELAPEYLKPDTAAAEARYDEWNNAMSSDVPEFAGEEGGQSQIAPERLAANTGYDDDLAKAAGSIRALDAPAQKYGAGAVMEAIKTTDISTSENPIGDIYQSLGVDTREEREELRDIREASKDRVDEFQDRTGMPPAMERTTNKVDAANRARFEIDELKSLATKVEGESARFAELRDEARAQGDNVYDVAVRGTKKRGMADLFEVLRTQEERGSEQPEAGATGETPSAGGDEAETPIDGDTKGLEGEAKDEEASGEEVVAGEQTAEVTGEEATVEAVETDADNETTLGIVASDDKEGLVEPVVNSLTVTEDGAIKIVNPGPANQDGLVKPTEQKPTV